MTTQKYSRESRWLIGLMIVSIAIHLYFSWISLHNLPETSDEASAALLAQDIADGARPLLFTGQPYQFPIEAYLTAPFAGVLPHNAIGARTPGLVLSLLSFIIFLATAWKIFKPGNRWPSFLLILFPSSYWLMHTSAYTPPQYASSSLLAALLFYLAATIAKLHRANVPLLAVTGLIGGIALSNHLLLLSVLAGVFVAIAFRGDWRVNLRAIFAFGGGLLVGLIPYLLALAWIPGAYENISDTRPLLDALKIIFSNTESSALFGAFGLNPPLFIDLTAHRYDASSIEYFVEMIYLGFLGTILLLRLPYFFRPFFRGTFPATQWPDLFLVTSLATLFLFAASSHSGPSDHRYLLPAVWSFPFLAGYVFTLAHSRLRGIVGATVVMAACYNLWISTDLINVWRDRKALQLAADTRDLSPLLNWLNAHHYDRCYSSFWIAYRVTYESDQHIICSLLYNERYFDWPIPYKQTVDEGRHVASILTNTYTSHFRTSVYEKMLSDLHIRYQRTPVELFGVYHDFSIPEQLIQKPITPISYRLSTNTANKNLSVLIDDNPKSSWDSAEMQDHNHWLQAEFKHKVKLSSVSLYYDPTGYSPARQISIEAKIDGEWSFIIEDVSHRIEPMRFANGHPIVGDFQQTIRFNPVFVDALRLKIIVPDSQNHWKFSELKLYQSPQ